MSKFAGIRNKHILVLTGNGMLSLVGFAISALLFHSMSRTNVGIWFFVQSIIALFEAIRYGFLSTATVKFYAGVAPERARTVLGSVWYLAFLLTGSIVLINACAFFFLPYIHNEELIACIKWSGIIFLCTMPSDVIFWRLQADEKYGTLLWYSTLNSGLSAIFFSVLIYLDKMTLETAFLSSLCVNLITSAVGILCNLSGMKMMRHRTKECIREIVNYGKYTLGTTSVSVMLANTDTWILNFMLGPSSVAVYSLSRRLLALIELPLRSFAVTGMSAMAIAFNTDNLPQVTHIYKKYSGMLTMFFIPIALLAVVFGEQAINMLGGPEYIHTEAADAYIIMMLIAVIYPIERLNGITLDIIHQTKVNFYKVIIMIIIKVVGDFAGIYMFQNVHGVVLAMFIVHFTALIYGNYQLKKHLDYTIGGILTTGFNESKLLIVSKAKALFAKRG